MTLMPNPVASIKYEIGGALIYIIIAKPKADIMVHTIKANKNLFAILLQNLIYSSCDISTKAISNHVSFILVSMRGMGFEPTNHYWNGS